MDWKPWNGDMYLDQARSNTDRLRSSDEGDFPRLRQALIKESIDPDSSVLAEYDFDPLSSTGVLIDSGGVPLKFETYWDPDEDELDVERISDDGGWYGKYIYAGWLIHEAEGREPQDLVSALVPVIRGVTTRFRDGHNIETSNRPRPMDWSLPKSLLEQEGEDPQKVVVITATSSVGGGKWWATAIFVLRDTRVFLFEGDMDEKQHLIQTTEWRELDAAEIADLCGPLHDAALRVMKEKRGTAA